MYKRTVRLINVMNIKLNLLFIVLILQIYTDWANHYLEKVKSKRRIVDLPNDVTDGCILADVIEAVSKSQLSSINLNVLSSFLSFRSRFSPHVSLIAVHLSPFIKCNFVSDEWMNLINVTGNAVLCRTLARFHTVGGLLLQVNLWLLRCAWHRPCSCMHFIRDVIATERGAVVVVELRVVFLRWKRDTEWIDRLMNQSESRSTTNSKRCRCSLDLNVNHHLPAIILTYFFSFFYSTANQKLPDVNRKPKTASQMVSASSNSSRD